MSRHTSEPWSVWTSNSHIRLSAAGDGDVCHATVASDGMPVLVISLDDARRIVACVNACAWIETDWLEFNYKLHGAGIIDSIVQSCNTEISDLKQQRDKLLDGLKRAERETGFINCQDLSALIAEVEASK